MVRKQRRTVKKLHKRRNILKGYSKKKSHYIQKKSRRKKTSYKRKRSNKRTRGKRRKFILSGGERGRELERASPHTRAGHTPAGPDRKAASNNNPAWGARRSVSPKRGEEGRDAMEFENQIEAEMSGGLAGTAITREQAVARAKESWGEVGRRVPPPWGPAQWAWSDYSFW